MADIVNLRSVRKRKAREEKARQADENRALHGTTKAQKLAQRTERDREAAALDGHRRERPSSSDPANSDQDGGR